MVDSSQSNTATTSSLVGWKIRLSSLENQGEILSIQKFRRLFAELEKHMPLIFSGWQPRNFASQLKYMGAQGTGQFFEGRCSIEILVPWVYGIKCKFLCLCTPISTTEQEVFVNATNYPAHNENSEVQNHLIKFCHNFCHRKSEQTAQTYQ